MAAPATATAPADAAAPAAPAPAPDAAKLAAIYTAFVAACPLTPAHRAELRTKRGLTDATIDLLKFRSAGDRREIERAIKATGASEADLVDAGLLVHGRGGAYPNPQLTEPRVLIPYLEKDGQTVSRLRPHKMGFEGMGVGIYCPFAAFAHPPDPLVLTEGEFKAAALYQLGYAAMAVPGISSFGGKHRERLQEAVRLVGAKQVVVCFDHETKADPALPSFKPDFRKRYDTEFWSWANARVLVDVAPPGTVKIARLPAAWMTNGKIDCDGALAAGKTRADFDATFATALDTKAFLETLDADAAAVVRRKARRFLGLLTPAALEENRDPNTGYGYVWVEFDDQGNATKRWRVSDFLLELQRVVHTDVYTERAVFIRDSYGERRGPFILKPDDLASPKGFRRWALSCGEHSWSGGEKALSALIETLNAIGDGAEIRRTTLVGEIEDGLWLTQNGVLTHGHYVAPSAEDGICWIGRKGYELELDADQPRLLVSHPEACRDLPPKVGEVLTLLRENMRGRATAWLGIGWGLATIFSKALFQRFKCFPILYCHGDPRSGKTTFARWLMNGLFGIPTHGKPMMSTEKHHFRLLAKRCSLPAWYDEFRETRDFARHVTAFCSIYNRQGYGRAQRTLDLKTDDVPVRGALLLGGVVLPKDDQLLSRCVTLRFNENDRDNRAAVQGGTYTQIERRLEELNALFVHAVLRYDDLVGELIETTQTFTDMFREETGNSRMAINYGMCVAAWAVVVRALVPLDALVDHARLTMTGSTERLDAEHPLNAFWEGMSAMAASGNLSRAHVDVDAERIYLWLPGIYQEYRAFEARRHGDVPFREKDLMDWIKAAPWYIQPNPEVDDRKTGDTVRRATSARRMNGSLKRVIAIRTAMAPQALVESAEHITKSMVDVGRQS